MSFMRVAERSYKFAFLHSQPTSLCLSPITYKEEIIVPVSLEN